MRYGKFKLQLRIGSVGKRQLSKTSLHLVDGLLHYELMFLVVDQPTSLRTLSQIGNYEEVAHLTGAFQLFSNPAEYYLQLARFLCKLTVDNRHDEDLDTMIEVCSGENLLILFVYLACLFLLIDIQ
jgi:hypothetical protein